MECFRVDESGYTGYDLLREDQQFQGATAIAISDADAAVLIKEHFPGLQASELKYRSLARRPANKSKLIALQRDILSNYKCVTYICSKRYLLILMFLDYAVEPYYYDNGVNFYEGGQHYALASLLFFAGPSLLGEREFDALLAAFQRAVKEKSPDSIRDLILATRQTNWREMPEALGPLAQYEYQGCIDAILNPDVNTDAAFVVLLSLISRMEAMSDGHYSVEHDRSKNLLTYHDLIQRFIDHDEEKEFRQTEITSLKFPLKLRRVTQVDSKASPAVQLADVVIGAAIDATYMLAGMRSGDPEVLTSLYRDDQLIHLVPSIDFEEQRRFRQGSQSAELIDYVAKNLVAPPTRKR